MLLGGGLEHSVPRRIGQVPSVPPAPDLQLLEGVPRRLPPPQHRGAFSTSSRALPPRPPKQLNFALLLFQVACALLDQCGRFLYRNPETHVRAKNMVRCTSHAPPLLGPPFYDPFIAYLSLSLSITFSLAVLRSFTVGHHDATKGQQEPGQPPGEQRRECLLPMHPARTSCAQGSLLLSHLELSWRRSTCSM